MFHRFLLYGQQVALALSLFFSLHLSHSSNGIIGLGLLCHLIESYQGLLCLTGMLLLLSQTTA